MRPRNDTTSSPRNPPPRRRAARLALSVVIAFGALSVAGTQALAAMKASPTHMVLGSLELAFVDQVGKVVSDPVVDIERPFPGMPVLQVPLAIENTGSVAFRLALSVTDLRASADHSLADVLVVKVAGPSGTALYRGPLAGLRAGLPALAPGHSVSLQITVSWPERGPADNAYQGQSLSFAFSAAAHQVVA